MMNRRTRYARRGPRFFAEIRIPEEHLCVVCGARASFATGRHSPSGKVGRWTCSFHRPEHMQLPEPPPK